MLYPFGHSILGNVLLVLLALAVVAWGAWWANRWYFPSAILCMAVHKILPRIFEKELRLLSRLESPSVIGFLTALLLPTLICLNVSLLAQVFELFVPPGQRITFPLIGSYATFPLIVGLLFALSQVALATVRKIQKQEGQKGRWVLALMIVTVIVEVGLNIYRAFLLTSGKQLISPTIWDQVFVYGGPGLAGLLGFIVPTTEMLLSPYALVQFVQPAIKDVAILLHSLLAFALMAISWLLFGFHNRSPVTLPAPVGRLRDEQDDLKAQQSALIAAVARIRESLRRIDEPPPGVRELETRLARLKDKVNAVQLRGSNGNAGTLAEGVRAFDATIATITDKRAVRLTLVKIQGWTSQLRSDLEPRGNEVEVLDRVLGDVRERHSSWSKQLTEVRTAIDDTRALMEKLVSCESSIGAEARDIASVLHGDPSPGVKLPMAEVAELQTLVIPPGDWDRHDKVWGQRRLAASEEVLQEAFKQLKSAELTVADCSRTLDQIQAGLPCQGELPDEDHTGRLSEELVDLHTSIRQTEKSLRDQVKLWRRDLRSKALSTRAVGLYAQLLAPWSLS